MTNLHQQIARLAKELEGETARFPNEHCPLEHLSGASGFYAAFVARLNGKA